MASVACFTVRLIHARHVAQSSEASGFAFYSSRSLGLGDTALSMLHRVDTLVGSYQETRKPSLAPLDRYS
jgi:hypothetical protein